jgi:hypothetical protein
MKKIITTIFAIALSIGVFAQQSDTIFVHKGQTVYEFVTTEIDSIVFHRTRNVSATSVTLNHHEFMLAVGDTLPLVATVLPANANNKNVTWKSNNIGVATVDNNGRVIAVKSGVATITVTTQDGEKTAFCEINVKAGNIPVTSIRFDTVPTSLFVGDTFVLTAIIKPFNATDKEIAWNSTNNNVAKVENGKITALSVGSSVISVTTLRGNNTASCVVIVSEDIVPPIDSVVCFDTIIHLETVTHFDTIVHFDTITHINTITLFDTIIYFDTIVYIDTILPPVIPPTDIETVSCNSDTPNWWRNSLGRVYFVTDETWTVGTQIWSDEVKADGCIKSNSNYDGGNINGTVFKADCFTDLAFIGGDFFSWCMVMRFRENLCPYPWRVPTKDEFIALDIALDGSGENRNTASSFYNTYRNFWGMLIYTTTGQATYWSQTAVNLSTNQSHTLYFGGGTFTPLHPQGTLNRNSANRLRCIKD